MFFSAFERPDFSREGRDWPNRDASRFVSAGGLRWHVQRAGKGPRLLLVHGTGAATHSWRDVFPALAEGFDVLAMDMPGHGFSDPLPARKMSLPGMAQALGALLKAENFAPDAAVGHSAGAAILAQLCLDGGIAPRALVSLNGAFLPFAGMAGALFPPMAKLLFGNPLAPRVFAWSADRAAVTRLMRGTGSEIDARGIDFYARLFACSGHVAGALAMMANWELEGLERNLPKLRPQLTLVVGAKDLAIPPGDAKKVAAAVPGATVTALKGLGHLAHEEDAEAVIAVIRSHAEAAPC